ncbi:hypothetical protein C7212DRAFT_275529 [Tuber magnatum]|uniref:Uncharacterized protein n=1 Tax=Tuber magnatum TaxID=42249 RepID=A0A317T1V3_9PEZI|nr:hypothetical protein C7212DRAFT_275529 [Tuber magnatum]
METVTNAATAAANTVQRAIFGNRATRDESVARDDNTQHVGRSAGGASSAIDEPRRSRETVTDPNPLRHSTGAPEHVTSPLYNQRDKGELSTGSTDYRTNSSTSSEDLPKATDHSPNGPLIGNADKVSSPGGKDIPKMHHGDPGDRGTRGKAELNALLGKTEPGGHGTHNRSASLGKTEPGSRKLSNQPSGGLGKTELGKSKHSSTDSGKTEGKTEFGRVEFAKSAQGKTELGTSPNYPASPNRNTNISAPLAGDRGRKEPGIGHGTRTGIPHISDLDTSPGPGLGSGLTNKPSSANETSGRSHLSQPSTAGSTADKPLGESSSSGNYPGAAASNTGGPRPLGSDTKLDNESHGEGTGEKYEKSTGLAADGGDFDATRPGAGKEADRLLEEKGIHRAAKGSTNLEEEKAKKRHGVHQKVPGESQGSGSEHKGLTTKIKEKLRLGHH